MKSNSVHTEPIADNDLPTLLAIIKNEKEKLVSMFLSNASITELAEQYKRIDELNEMIRKISSLNR